MLEIIYTHRYKNITSDLIIVSTKPFGYSNTIGQLGTRFYGDEADYMFDFFKNNKTEVKIREINHQEVHQVKKMTL